MKNILIAFFLLVSTVSFAQVSVDGEDVNKMSDVQYIKMTAYVKPLTANKYGIIIDYGQKMKFLQEVRITDANGKAVTFNGEIDALNFLDKNGWEFVNSYATFDQNSTYMHYIMKKRKSS